jgi:hypothetical protein
MSDELLDRIEVRLAGVEFGQARVETGLEEVRVHLTIVDRRLDKLEVTVEGLRDDVRQVAEGHAAVLAEIVRSTEAVIAHIDKRIVPLEEAFRAHFGTR